MSKLVAVVYVTMDGMMEDPLLSRPFWTDEHAKFQHGQLFGSRALLLGRVTYEKLAAHWPRHRHEDAFAERMNSIPKYVASTTLHTAGWNAVILKGDVAAAVTKLKSEPSQDLLVYGSGELVTYLIRHGLVDELKLFVHPVIAGTGKRLFPDGMDPVSWRLAGIVAFSSGAVVLDYRPTTNV